MSKKLSVANPYLRDPVVRKESLWVAEFMAIDIA